MIKRQRSYSEILQKQIFNSIKGGPMQLSEEEIRAELTDEEQGKITTETIKTWLEAWHPGYKEHTKLMAKSQYGYAADQYEYSKGIVDRIEDVARIALLKHALARTRIENRALRGHIKKYEWIANYQDKTVECIECGVTVESRHLALLGAEKALIHAPDCRTAKLLEGE
jgi:hypothetical protein